MSPMRATSITSSLTPPSETSALLSLSEIHQRRSLRTGGSRSCRLSWTMSDSAMLPTSSLSSCKVVINYLLLMVVLALVLRTLFAVTAFDGMMVVLAHGSLAVLEGVMAVFAHGKLAVFEGVTAVYVHGILAVYEGVTAVYVYGMLAVHEGVMAVYVYGMLAVHEGVMAVFAPVLLLVSSKLLVVALLLAFALLLQLQLLVLARWLTPQSCLLSEVVLPAPRCRGLILARRCGSMRQLVAHVSVRYELLTILLDQDVTEYEVLMRMVRRFYKLPDCAPPSLCRRCALCHISSTKHKRWGSTDDLMLLRSVLLREHNVDFDPALWDAEAQLSMGVS
eukprot:1033310-Amphidinium_carterae.1